MPANLRKCQYRNVISLPWSVCIFTAKPSARLVRVLAQFSPRFFYGFVSPRCCVPRPSSSAGQRAAIFARLPRIAAKNLRPFANFMTSSFARPCLAAPKPTFERQQYPVSFLPSAFAFKRFAIALPQLQAQKGL